MVALCTVVGLQLCVVCTGVGLGDWTGSFHDHYLRMVPERWVRGRTKRVEMWGYSSVWDAAPLTALPL